MNWAHKLEIADRPAACVVAVTIGGSIFFFESKTEPARGSATQVRGRG